MGCYKNFKSVIYCTAQNMAGETEDSLREQLKFFQKYCGVDKVYLEPYRDGLMLPEEQLSMLIRVFIPTSSAWGAPTATPTRPCGNTW